jgi:hypothetical protein
MLRINAAGGVTLHRLRYPPPPQKNQMAITATRAPARDLSPARKAYANQVEEATGWTIAWRYCTKEQQWAFYLLDPCGDQDGDPFYCWDDLTDYCQDAVDEYEHEALYDSIEPKFYDDLGRSDAEGGL